MTIEGQLRELARHIDEHQPVITAAEIVQRVSGQRLDRTSPDDAGGSRPHLTIARPLSGAGFGPMEEMRMSDDSADGEQKTRWRIPAVAAAIVVVGVGVIAFAVSNTNADDDGVSQAPVVTAEPTTAVASRVETKPVLGTDITLSYTLPDGWEPARDDGLLISADPATVNFWDVNNVYADGCEHIQLDPPLGPSVDDLATVWATLPGFTASTPVDITVDGYSGKRVDYTVPDYPTVIDPATGEEQAECANDQFALWTERYGGLGPNFWAQVPAQQNRQWIIDVDGTRLVINEWSEPGTTPEQLAKMDEFLASLQIG